MKSDELARYGYDEAVQSAFARRAAQATSNAVTGNLSPLPASQIARLPALGTPDRARLRDAGLELIGDGKVGAVVLAGGMATRFGGVVKAVVPALGEKSFLEIKHADIAAFGKKVPMLVMSSFATHDAIKQHIADKKLSGTIDVFPQLVALRLTPTGELYKDASGEVSPYATGHGDLTFALRASGALARFRAAGGTTLLMSNVDNLAATLDPAIIGLHHELGGAMTVEVAPKIAGDKGGAPAMLDGTPQIIEGFRFPPTFDQDSIDVFNTNTFVLDAALIDHDFELPYYRVEKTVDGDKVIQFERLAGELTAFLPSRFIRIERDGADSRFLPVKDPEELERQRPLIGEVMRSRRSFEG
ncbi:MAG: UTP--glucose-1-phosphate uridylyltransferase [Deltaproteobacteria bacterium]|nr:UTP--glucose-1-phosphate uridylyltransferase [Deltaproteobacteria bacterium]